MVRKLFFITLVALFAMSSAAFASGDAGKCATKYPVVLCHGMAMQGKNVQHHRLFLGRRKRHRERGWRGLRVSVNAMDNTENKARQFKQDLLEIMAISKAQKVNLVNHSHGFLYTRLAMTNMDCAKYVASHTSICGPTVAVWLQTSWLVCCPVARNI